MRSVKRMKKKNKRIKRKKKRESKRTNQGKGKQRKGKDGAKILSVFMRVSERERERVV